MADRHGWNSWNQYQHIHGKKIDGYLDHFILDDQLTAEPTEVAVRWAGVLYCVDGLELHVRKTQDVELRSGWAMVRTVQYSYHALRRVAGEGINLVRYDNIHSKPGHADRHHRHKYDGHGVEIEPTEHVGEANWPTLGDVLDELYQRWADQRRQ